MNTVTKISTTNLLPWIMRSRASIEQLQSICLIYLQQRFLIKVNNKRRIHGSVKKGLLPTLTAVKNYLFRISCLIRACVLQLISAKILNHLWEFLILKILRTK